jgi:acyl transferase domain-containing protein
MKEQEILPLQVPASACKLFDTAADGYARGEAVNAMYIKRLDDTVRDKDAVRAVIRAGRAN